MGVTTHKPWCIMSLDRGRPVVLFDLDGQPFRFHTEDEAHAEIGALLDAMPMSMAKQNAAMTLRVEYRP